MNKQNLKMLKKARNIKLKPIRIKAKNIENPFAPSEKEELLEWALDLLSELDIADLPKSPMLPRELKNNPIAAERGEENRG